MCQDLSTGTPSATNATKPKRRQRKISFASKQRVKPIPPLSTFTKKDIERTWYSRGEVETITQEANDLVILAEESQSAQSDQALDVHENFDGESIRGLERKTEQGNVEAFLSRVAVYDAVLDEQDAQWAKPQANKNLDSAKIAKLCEQASSKAKLAAFQRAKQDRAAVQDYLYLEVQQQEELELSLQDVFTSSNTATTTCTSKPRSSLSKHFQKEANTSISVKSDESWITRGTCSTASMSTDSSNWDTETEADDDGDATTVSTMSTCSGSSTSTRASFTNAKKVTTPRVPRINSKTKRHTPPKRHSSSFKRTNGTATTPMEAMTNLSAKTKKSTLKQKSNAASGRGRGSFNDSLSLKCSAFL